MHISWPINAACGCGFLILKKSANAFGLNDFKEDLRLGFIYGRNLWGEVSVLDFWNSLFLVGEESYLLIESSVSNWD